MALPSAYDIIIGNPLPGEHSNPVLASYNAALASDSSEPEIDLDDSSSAIEAYKRYIESANEYNAQQAALDRAFQQSSAREAMAFEAQEAQKLREWQEYLTRHQYKIAMDSMREAGLNPILAYTQGGASVPSGTSASGFSAGGRSSSAMSANYASAAASLMNADTNRGKGTTYAAGTIGRIALSALTSAASILLKFAW